MFQNNKMTLDEIGKKWNTDKSSKYHGYTLIYEKYFESLRNKKLDILEIGLSQGKGSRMLADYFKNSTIYGMDIRDVSEPQYAHERIIKCFYNQAIREDNINAKIENPHYHRFPIKDLDKGLKGFVDTYGDMDIIIDDGGHCMHQQLITLGYMFKSLKPGGLFVIEDMQTSRSKPQYKIYNIHNTRKTTLWVIDNFMKTGKIDSEYILPEEAKYLEENIEWCKIEKAPYKERAEITFIKKKD